MNQILYQHELFIPSTFDGLNKCLDIVYELTQRFNLDRDTIFCLNTVVIESVENAIIHGNKFSNDASVRVLIAVGLQEITVEVEDSGNGFDLNDIPSPVEGQAIGQEGGRGIFFIKSLSMSCYTLGRGNIIRIKLKR